MTGGMTPLRVTTDTSTPSRPQSGKYTPASPSYSGTIQVACLTEGLILYTGSLQRTDSGSNSTWHSIGITLPAQFHPTLTSYTAVTPYWNNDGKWQARVTQAGALEMREDAYANQLMNVTIVAIAAGGALSETDIVQDTLEDA